MDHHWSGNKKWLSCVRELKSSPPPPSIHTPPHMSCKSPTQCCTLLSSAMSTVKPDLLFAITSSKHFRGVDIAHTNQNCTVTKVQCLAMYFIKVLQCIVLQASSTLQWPPIPSAGTFQLHLRGPSAMAENVASLVFISSI